MQLHAYGPGDETPIPEKSGRSGCGVPAYSSNLAAQSLYCTGTTAKNSRCGANDTPEFEVPETNILLKKLVFSTDGQDGSVYSLSGTQCYSYFQ